jgi:hypothetical protein
MARAASVAHQELRQGLNALATITSLAPFVGMLGTLWAIGFDTFFGLGTERSTGMAMVANGISRACVPMALGLAVGVQSFWCYRYLQLRLEAFDGEMDCASLDLRNRLSRQFDRISSPCRAVDAAPNLPFIEAYARASTAGAKFERQCAIAAGALVFLAWCVEAIACFEFNSLPLRESLWDGLRLVAIQLGCFSLPAYAIWVDLLHRRPAAVPPIASALTLCSCVVGLFLPSIRF